MRDCNTPVETLELSEQFCKSSTWVQPIDARRSCRQNRAQGALCHHRPLLWYGRARIARIWSGVGQVAVFNHAVPRENLHASKTSRLMSEYKGGRVFVYKHGFTFWYQPLQSQVWTHLKITSRRNPTPLFVEAKKHLWTVTRISISKFCAFCAIRKVPCTDIATCQESEPEPELCSRWSGKCSLGQKRHTTLMFEKLHAERSKKNNLIGMLSFSQMDTTFEQKHITMVFHTEWALKTWRTTASEAKKKELVYRRRVLQILIKLIKWMCEKVSLKKTKNLAWIQDAYRYLYIFGFCTHGSSSPLLGSSQTFCNETKTNQTYGQT